MRRSTIDYIKLHKGEKYTRKTGTFIFKSLLDNSIAPEHIMEELERLGKFKITFDKFFHVYEIV